MGLKIVLLTAWYYPDSVGGTEKYVHCLAKDLQALGHDVTIGAPSDGANSTDLNHDGVPVHKYAAGTHFSREQIRFAEAPPYLEEFGKWLESLRPDIIHLHSLTTGCGVFHARRARETGARLFVTLHIPAFSCARGTLMRWGKIPCDGVMREFRCAACYLHGRGHPRIFSELAAPLKMRMIHNKIILCRRIFDLVFKVIVVSEWQMSVLLNNGFEKSKIVLCRHGLPATSAGALFESSNSTGGRVMIGYIGRFNISKGVHLLIEAVQSLPRDRELQLKLYGSANTPDDLSYLAQLKKMSRDDPRIEFAGTVSESDRATVLSSMDALAIPSTWFEAGPLVALEALQAGTPVLGHNFGGIPEIVKDGVNGLIVARPTAKCWALVFNRLLTDPSILKSLKSVRTPVRKSEQVCEDMLALYTCPERTPADR